MTEKIFDPEAILNTTVSEDDLSGKKTMAPEGSYPNCLIKAVRVFEPHERAIERGVEARLLVTFECPGDDVDLTHGINFKRKMSPKATYAKLLRAVWPDKAEAASKTMRDLEGENVNVSVFHEEAVIDGRSVSYADYRFTPVS